MLVSDFWSTALAMLMSGLALILLVGGTAWLVFRRCRLSLAQLLAAIVTLGGMMALVRETLSLSHEREAGAVFPLLLLVPLWGVGLFVGAKNAMLVPERWRFTRWLLFFAGLVAPATIIPGIVVSWLVLVGQNPFRDHPGGVFIWVMLVVPAVSTIFVQKGLYELPRQKESPGKPN